MHNAHNGCHTSVLPRGGWAGAGLSGVWPGPPPRPTYGPGAGQEQEVCGGQQGSKLSYRCQRAWRQQITAGMQAGGCVRSHLEPQVHRRALWAQETWPAGRQAHSQAQQRVCHVLHCHLARHGRVIHGWMCFCQGCCMRDTSGLPLATWVAAAAYHEVGRMGCICHRVVGQAWAVPLACAQQQRVGARHMGQQALCD
jgi:hypothetical protein